MTLGVALVATSADAQSRAVRQIGVLLSSGAATDGGFNQAAAEGAARAASALRLALELRPGQSSEGLETVRAWLRRGETLVIAIGYENSGIVDRLSLEFPGQPLAIVDSIVARQNVLSVLFREEEAAHLVGVIAARTSRSGVVGFIGGVPIPPVLRFQCGFLAGAQWARAEVRVLSAFVGGQQDGFTNRIAAAAAAQRQFADGADIVFQAAGTAGLAVIEAAAAGRPGRYAIGVDRNQNGVAPGRVLTSAVKRVDVAVAFAVQRMLAPEWRGGVVRLGLAERAVDWALDVHNRPLISPEIEAAVDAAKLALLTGETEARIDNPACEAVE